MSEHERATTLLQSYCAGTEQAAEDLLPLVYAELRRLAAASLRSERADHTMQATELVHEAWLRLIDEARASAADPDARQRFVALSSRVMRQVLVDHARKRGAAKRGSGRQEVTLHEWIPGTGPRGTAVLDLESALQELESRDAHLARVAEMRLLGGLSLEEIAALLGVSHSKVKGDWSLARAMLARSLNSLREQDD